MDVRSVPVAKWPTTLALPPAYTVAYVAPPVHQGSCGACWAIAATSCYCDRAGIPLTEPAYHDVTDNARECVRHGRAYGCNARCAGGFTVSALAYLCSKHNMRVYRVNLYDTFGVVNKLYVDSQPLTAAQMWRSADNIAREIVMRGSVCATFNLFSDFLWFWQNAPEEAVYRLGMYTSGFNASNTQGSKAWTRTAPGPGGNVFVVSHSVVIIGYGTVPEPHWLCRSSWGRSQNRPHGLFRIVRGVNMCGIEADVLACQPAVSTTASPVYGALERAALCTPHELLVAVVAATAVAYGLWVVAANNKTQSSHVSM